MDIKTAFDMFLDRDGISQLTRSKYYYRLRGFVEKNGNKRPQAVTVTELLAYMAAQSHLAEASKALLVSCFHAFLSFCGVDPNPADALPRYRETPKRIKLPQEEAVRLALAEALKMSQGDDPPMIRDGLIFALAVVSGNRRGEIRNIPLSDVLTALDFPQETQQGRVYRVFTQGKTGEAVLRFTDFHVPAIRRYLNVRPATNDPAFFVNLNEYDSGYGRRLSLVAFDRVRPKVCKRAGVQTITYQELRRRLATIIARSDGVDVAALLLNHSPHSGDRVVRAYYYDPDKHRADVAAAAAFGTVA